VILRVRKLFPVPVLACLLAVPAAFGATPSPDTDSERAMITAPLGNDPLDAAEARSSLKAAERDAQRAAERAAGPEREASTAPAAAVPPQLEAIAACESGGNPQAVGGGGAYRGKYQFSTSTWAAVGGSGDPAAAPEAEQDRRAAMLYAQSGAGQWPVCGS
jgi:Transglycosylase-like domain